MDLFQSATDYIRVRHGRTSCFSSFSSSFHKTSYTMASAPDTTSIPGYTIFREGDYDSVAATAMLPQGTPHPLGM